MPTCLHRFGPDDIFHNRVKTHPQYEFYIYDSVVYLNKKSLQSGSFTPSVPNVDPGFVNLYELNVDRIAGDTGLIHPFITKGGGVEVLRTGARSTRISDQDFFTQFGPGARITGSYPLTASIKRDYFPADSTRKHVDALKNTLNFYVPLSKHYQFSSDLGNKGSQAVNLISIPSIFYGSSIKKGSVDLRFYVTGTMVGQLRDINQNGELIQVAPVGSPKSGSVAGVALYNEGFLCLTGAWGLNDTELKYTGDTSVDEARWLYFGVGANDGVTGSSGETASLQTRASASFMMAFSGTHFVPNVTMMAHAPRAKLNWSNNPTYIDQESSASFANPLTGAYQYVERDRIIANTVSASFTEPTASFRKTTYISKVAIYDQYKNVIGIATVATPVKKTEDRDLTFKLKLDM
tara:strand:+ start:1455 stop:2672 length:1218 start_codon:yes stop_codon:yes gene_type:complete